MLSVSVLHGNNKLRGCTKCTKSYDFSDPNMLEVSFKRMDKDAYYLKIEDYTIVSWRNPVDELKKVGAQVGPSSVGGNYESSTKSDWNTVMYDPEKRLMPLEAWTQEWKEKVSYALSQTSGSNVTPSTISPVFVGQGQSGNESQSIS